MTLVLNWIAIAIASAALVWIAVRHLHGHAAGGGMTSTAMILAAVLLIVLPNALGASMILRSLGSIMGIVLSVTAATFIVRRGRAA